MAQIEKLIPHILLWECSVTVQKGETLQHAYERARAKGVVTLKNDSGGATMCGVTIRTFQEWRVKRGERRPTVNDLKALSYSEWLAILKSVFWDPCKGDQIVNQSIANMLIDWRWVNGTQAIRDAQTILSLVADGIVGPKTLGALNAPPAVSVFNRLKVAREKAYRKIVERSPAKKGFLVGWLNRTDSIEFEK
ncbi:MAG: peptidoglycan domain protein [Muribaculaceae bacterium]|nr:peptidoglycan domain protein [Muribaculaceae bacterium]